ncbi:MAG: UPF0175 family protein [Pyrinomonadaceae bacterium]
MDVQIKIPDEIFNRTSEETSRQVLEAVALEGYKSDQLTAAQVKRLLGFNTRLEVYDFLAENGVAWVDSSPEDAERESDLLQELAP